MQLVVSEHLVAYCTHLSNWEVAVTPLSIKLTLPVSQAHFTVPTAPLNESTVVTPADWTSDVCMVSGLAPVMTE